MTRVLKTILLTGTALALLAAAPARSVEAVNHVSPNGLSPNVISPNGLNPNRLSPNAMSPNRVSPNGISSNLMSPNGIMPNGLSPGGVIGSDRPTNSAGEIGRVIAVELPRRSGAGIPVWPERP
jgi:hypothetical protein